MALPQTLRSPDPYAVPTTPSTEPLAAGGTISASGTEASHGISQWVHPHATGSTPSPAPCRHAAESRSKAVSGRGRDFQERIRPPFLITDARATAPALAQNTTQRRLHLLTHLFGNSLGEPTRRCRARCRCTGRSRGSPSSRHRSMKCSCAAERSFSSDARHLAMNSPGVMAAPTTASRRRADSGSHRLIRTIPSKPDSAVTSCSGQDAAT